MRRPRAVSYALTALGRCRGTRKQVYAVCAKANCYAAGNRTCREELADGAKPLALPDARTGSMLRKGLDPWVLREGQQPPEARPGCRKTPPWRAERRGHSGNGMLTHGNTGAPFGAPHPRLFEGTEKEVGLPGAANNTGDDARLDVCRPRESGDLYAETQRFWHNGSCLSCSASI